ncbi:CBASS cGAMP synthase [Lysinibacillus parviboronicapiens]|uniref:CBASS cGAMP synthase n=1 Tax=Lysinibacillus parviboronicapiens TaxID=436516 RepID=UPI000D3791A3|nr:nucleotidyltransferase [Lysinibacillus parviboronicapiens]
MAECNDLFLKFNGEIELKNSKKTSLRTSRNSIRNDIINHFEKKLKVSKPKFWGQGSYMMNTIIKPIDGEYDIDDGVYLEHLAEIDEEEWPTAETVHNWIIKAVQDRTHTPPKNKNTCVRVIYKGNYHIDLPIYIKSKDSEHPKLAHKTKGWVDSDPKELTNWFKGQVSSKDTQLKRLVRYFKSWKDFKKNGDKFPSGMIFTILAANHYVEGYEDADDSAFIAVAQEIYDALNANFSLNRPVFPEEELFEDWSDTAKTNFLSKLSTLINNGQKALETEDKAEASKIWIKQFGDRFPEFTPPKEQNNVEKGYALKASAPPILGNYGRSS